MGIKSRMSNIANNFSRGFSYAAINGKIPKGVSSRAYQLGAWFGKMRYWWKNRISDGLQAGHGGWNVLAHLHYQRVWYRFSKGLIPFFIAIFALDFALFQTFYWIFVIALIGLIGFSLLVGSMPFDSSHIILIVAGIIIFFLLPSFFTSPDLKIVIMHYLLSNFSFLTEYEGIVWSIILLTVAGSMFFIGYNIENPIFLILFSIIEAVIFLLVIPSVTGFVVSTMNPEARRFYLRKYCKSPIYSHLIPECRILQEGEEKEIERGKKLVPVQGKIRLRVGTPGGGYEASVPGIIFSNANYVLPLTVDNQFDEKIRFQLAGVLQAGTSNYKFVTDYPQCPIGSNRWCEVEKKNVKSFVVTFNESTIRIEDAEICNTPTPDSTSECRLDESTGKTVGCSPGEECLRVFMRHCECVSWKNATCKRKMFFYPGAKIKFKVFFGSTENFVMVKGIKPQIPTKVAFRQDDVEIFPLFIPDVWDVDVYKNQPVRFILKISNLKKGTLVINNLTLRTVKKEGKPELDLIECENLNVNKHEDDYFVYYDLGFENSQLWKEIPGKRELYIQCSFKVPDYTLTEKETRIVSLDVMMNYTYEKEVVSSKYVVVHRVEEVCG
ncbi:MAG: hypothetical protein J7K98_00870 [Candidatus Aenigmarchaeota archaeon]|nr:hypothetical protein [Candidatus Aenigmarchaeota archaeon]